MQRLHVLLPICVLLGSAINSAANFVEGEIVPSARRGQYHGSRTVWHDLLGRHCPKFEWDTTELRKISVQVAIPIPQPKGFKAIFQSYKIQFAFDGRSLTPLRHVGDRVLTSWRAIICKTCPQVPEVQVELEHRDNILTGAHAQVYPASLEYLQEHQELLFEFQNETHWPKHLLVHYKWRHTHLVNPTAGLYVIFFSGILLTMALTVSALVSYQDKLQAFLADIAADETGHSGVSWDTVGIAADTQKAD